MPPQDANPTPSFGGFGLRAMPQDVEVIVVDDGSTDGTHNAVRSVNHANLMYIRQVNGGPASARNAGIAAASGEFVVFTDDDCVPTGSWPWPLVNRLSNAATGVAGVGGRVLPVNGGLFSRYYTFHRILEPPPNCAYVVTANCTYRKEVLVEVGGFDSAIKHPGGEDPALSAAVRTAGYSLGYEPSAVVLHEYRESLWDFLKTFNRYGKGCANVVDA